MTDTNALADELEAKLAACEREGVTFKAGWNLIRATIAALRTAEDYRNRAEQDAEISSPTKRMAKTLGAEWVPNKRAEQALAERDAQTEARVTGEIVAWLQELATHTTKYSPTTIADNIKSGYFAHWAETQRRGDHKESQ